MPNKQKYYITTPIYYPSGKWHLGTCYTTVICDALARFKRMQGMDVFYLTGTDEHGQKIEKVAQTAGVPTMDYINNAVTDLKNLWALLDISYDKFIRTTEEYHEKAVQKIFQKLFDQGDIYKSQYEGWYCTPCESFWTKSQLVDGKCPDCGRDVELMKEESYFFKISKYQDRLIKLIEDNPDFLQPKSRQNEMLNNFLRPGLQDLCVSRTSFDWGVKVPFDPKHVVYVWIDALTNYITALGYASDDDTLFKKFWPADLHMMGKEIVRFHSIIWPAILMALDLPLPKKVYGHGWLLLGSDKISKSKGNNIIDPYILSERYSVDAVRYYLLREIPFGQDGSYSNKAFLSRVNSDLVNDLGNFVSRTIAMIEQYFGGVIPTPCSEEINELDKDLIATATEALPEITKMMDDLLVPEALDRIWKIIRRANKYIDETAPWALNKEATSKNRLATIMYNLAETIRFVATLLQPFLTKCTKVIFEKLGVSDSDLMSFKSLSKFGMLNGETVSKGEALFLRVNIEKEMAEMEKISAEIAKAKELKSASVKADSDANNTANSNIDNASNTPNCQCAKSVETCKTADTDSPQNAKATSASEINLKEENANAITLAEISIDDFAKINLRVGKVVACEPVPKTEKLLKLTVDLGEEKLRTIVSGIALSYTAQQMVGKQIVVVANLKPCKLRGILSEGMILCASDSQGKLAIVSPEVQMDAGSEVR
ncbi:MAG: methionine--tRNA ligase [Clostridia bacterium]